MPAISNELMYEVLKSIQARVAGLDGKFDELRLELQGVKTHMLGLQQHMLGLQQEMGGMHATLVRYEQRLDRIERRLELKEAAPS